MTNLAISRLKPGDIKGHNCPIKVSVENVSTSVEVKDKMKSGSISPPLVDDKKPPEKYSNVEVVGFR